MARPQPCGNKRPKKWDEYTKAKEDIFAASSTETTPWIMIKSGDKNCACIESKNLLSQHDTSRTDALLHYARHTVCAVQEELGRDCETCPATHHPSWE